MNESNYLSGEFTDGGFPVSANTGRHEEACARRAIATLYRLLERQIAMVLAGASEKRIPNQRQKRRNEIFNIR